MTVYRSSPKWRGVRQPITHRHLKSLNRPDAKRRRTVVVRTLACGHRHVEPDGGRAKDAQFALCRECAALKQLESDLWRVVQKAHEVSTLSRIP